MNRVEYLLGPIRYGSLYRFLAPRSRKPRQARKGAAVVMEAGAEGLLVQIATLLTQKIFDKTIKKYQGNISYWIPASAGMTGE